MYLIFSLHENKLAIDLDEFEVEATHINKFISNEESESILDGTINYKRRTINVLDLSPLYGETKLKKFDGLLFVKKDSQSECAIKFEGFCRFAEGFNGEVLNINNILNQI